MLAGMRGVMETQSTADLIAASAKLLAAIALLLSIIHDGDGLPALLAERPKTRSCGDLLQATHVALLAPAERDDEIGRLTPGDTTR